MERRVVRFFGADQFFDGRDQLIFLHRLGQECGRAFFHGAIAMLRAGAGGDDQHGNFAA